LFTKVASETNYDLFKVLAAGLAERTDAIQNFTEMWDLMKAAGMLPK